VAPRHRSGIPLEQGWIVRKEAQNFAGLVDYTDVYEMGARRFDMGERSNFVGVAMGIAAMTQINAWGIGAIAEALSSHTAAIAEGAAALGFQSADAGDRAGHMIGLRHPDGLPADIDDRLARDRIFVSIRGDSIRISPHLHTSKDDIDRLLRALDRR
jgi:selenocysteine lyase/cysteine desulfurase